MPHFMLKRVVEHDDLTLLPLPLLACERSGVSRVRRDMTKATMEPPAIDKTAPSGTSRPGLAE